MESVPVSVFVWIGILFCISQSAMFSGLNLALLSISRLRLEVEAAGSNPDAIKILALRKDSHFVGQRGCQCTVNTAVKLGHGWRAVLLFLNLSHYFYG